MGGSQSSTNIAETQVGMLSEAYNSSLQQCMSSSAQAIGINIINSPGTQIEDNKFEQYARSSTTCTQKVAYDTSLSNSLDATFKQQADNAMAMFKLGIGDQSSYNMTRNTLNLANVIKNSATQQCAPSSLQSFMLNIINSPGSTFMNNVVKQTSDTVIDCTQGVATKTAAANDLKMVFDQVSKNSQETLTGVLEMLIIMAVVVCLVFIVVGGAGGTTAIKQMLDWKTLLAAGVVAVLIFGAYLWYQGQSQKRVVEHMETKAADSNKAFELEAVDVLKRITGREPLNGIAGGLQMPLSSTLDENGLPNPVNSPESYYNPTVGYYWWDPTNVKSFTFSQTGDKKGPWVQKVSKFSPDASSAGTVDRTGAFPEMNTDGTYKDPAYANAQASYIRQWANRYGCAYDDHECDWSIVWRTGPSKPPNLRLIIAKLLDAQGTKDTVYKEFMT